MPVVWTSDTEARLLAGFFRVLDLKIGKKELEELAEIIGPDCTPKAISHRIQKYKNMAAEHKKGFDNGEVAQDDESGPVTPKQKKGTPGKKAGKASGKKRAVAEANDEGEGEEKGDDVEVAKKLKVEVQADEDGHVNPDLL